MKIEAKYNIDDKVHLIYKYVDLKYDGWAKWLVRGTDRIGQVRVGAEYRLYRLCRSGTVWPEDHLFNSHKEAQAECDRKNGDLNNEN